ncbi:MAG: hypothetical protein PHT07_02295 [Paludibacter sp.]|nr:hypothetical protein [Paludibacter sp.]
MKGPFIERVKAQSTEKLIKTLLNYSEYQDQYVRSAEKELIARGIQLTPDERKEIENKKIKDKEEIEDDVNFRKFLMGGWFRYVVKDESAPELFSLTQIMVCSVLFTGLTGGILFTYNLLKLKTTKPIIIVLVLILSTILSICYVCAFYYLYDPSTIGSRHIFRSIAGGNMFVSLALFSNLWWNYIGKDLRYRSKSFIIPTIIGIIIIIAFLFRDQIIN